MPRRGGPEGAARLATALWLAGLLVGGVLPDCSLAADERRPPAVLLLVPGQPTGTQTSTDSFASAARASLLDALPPGSSVHMEYTDLARLGTVDEQATLRDWYKVKYARAPIDLIIAVGREPRVFLTRFRPELWPALPVIFGGIEARTLDSLRLPSGTTALTIRYDEEGTIRAALALLPDTRHVALVSGASDIDRYLRGLWLAALGRLGHPLQLIDLAGRPLEELRGRLAALPPHTVVFFSSVFTDGVGRTLVGAEVLPGLAQASSRPMFTIHGPTLGLGVVGGSMTDYAALGRQTGELGARLLGGAGLPQVPVEATGVNQLRFDWRVLRRWGLDERRLPGGSTVLYRPPSAWELYRWPITIGLSVLLAQAFLIAALLVQRAQRRRVQRALDERLRFETFLTDLSRSFVDAPAERIDDSIRQGLRRIGEFLALDRVSLLELAHRRRRAQVIYAWSAAGVAPVPAELAAEAFPWMSRQIGQGAVVTFTRPEELPPEATADTAAFVAHGTRSHASIPLVEDGVTRRLLTLSTVRDQRAWPEPLVKQLGLIVEILGQILARKQAEVEVEESEALQRAMLSTLPSRIAVLDRDARLLAVNRAWLEHPEEIDAGPMTRAPLGTRYLDACREALQAGEAGAREVIASVEAVLAGESPSRAIEYMEKREGAERWFLLSVMALGGSQGGAVIARTDVTEQVLAREQLRQFSGNLLAAQEDERRRIARELHDDLNQRLVLLALEISQLDGGSAATRSASARRLAERVGEIAADVHRLAYRLHPFKLEYLGLAAAARSLCDEIGGVHDIAITFAERDIQDTLPADVAVCVYRVLQEALSNVVKHSGSTRAEVVLAGDGSAIRLSVRDFGMGMAPDVAPSSPGLGLTSIRERLRSVNGALTVDSAVAGGTELVVRIPLAPVGRGL